MEQPKKSIRLEFTKAEKKELKLLAVMSDYDLKPFLEMKLRKLIKKGG